MDYYTMLYLKINKKYHYVAINNKNHYLITKLTNVKYTNIKIGWFEKYCCYTIERVNEIKSIYVVLLDKSRN